jgi:aspartyl/asparaginyl beta-hydroxylase (cupin superfamily)
MKYMIFGLYAACILFVHFRGKARLPFFRQIFDHSSVVSPVNIFIYLFSKAPTHQAYLPVSDFKGLKLLQDNWQVIRDEALALDKLEKIRSEQSEMMTQALIPFLKKDGSAFILNGTKRSTLQRFNFVLKQWLC